MKVKRRLGDFLEAARLVEAVPNVIHRFTYIGDAKRGDKKQTGRKSHDVGEKNKKVLKFG